ncbi:MAG: LamG domain-containing protein [Planctomycetes bacterium]|nr:LamG domain-containing protein [Planctomycetota bacterium]
MIGRIAFRGLALLLVGVIAAAGVTQTQADLVGYWNFDDGTAGDLSANANHGIAGGSLTYETNTPTSSGLSMLSHSGGGSGNVLTVPTSASLQSINDTLTIAYWMNSNLGDNNDWVRLFQQGTEANGQQSWMVNRNGGNNEVNVRVDTTSQHNQNIATGGPAPFDESWHHMAISLNTDAWSKYVDGVKVSTGTYNGGNGLSNSRPLYMFGRNGAGEYVGGLDDIAVYNSALTEAQVQHIYTGGDPMALPAIPASRYLMDGNANDSAGPYDGTEQGGPLSYVASPIGGQALDLSGSNQYVDLTTADNLGLGGNFTVSAWVNPDTLGGDKSILGIDSGGGNRQMHLILRNDKALMGFYGNDTGGNRVIDTDRWQHITWRFQDGEQTIFVDGVWDASSGGHANLIPDQPSDVKIGRWGGGNYFDGQLDNVNIVQKAMNNAEVRAEYLAGGTHVEDFEASDGKLPANWYVGNGSNAIRLRTNENPNGQYGLGTSGSEGSPDHIRTVKDSNHDSNTDTAWGPVFTVNDDSGSIHFTIAGGSHTLNTGSQRNGGNAVALWDIAANDFVGGKNATRSGNGASYESQSISLSGLAGKELALVLVDRQEGGWAWGGVDSITTDPGAITLNGSTKTVFFDYHFDNPADWMGWTQEGEAGDPVNFTIGKRGTSGQSGWHVNLAGTFGDDRGHLSSGADSAHGGEENSTGVLRSPNFTIAGDILEFRISGGNTTDMGLELVRASDNTVLKTGRSQDNRNEMAYDYWNIGSLAGTEAYLRLRDERDSGGWSHIEVDAIRMVDLNDTNPNPLLPQAWGNAPIASVVHDVRNPGEIVVSAAGSDIQGNSDNGGGAFFSEKVSGTFDAVAHVSFDNETIPDGWTKAGLMFRASEDANAANVSVLATGSNRANLQWRDSAGGGTNYSQAGSGDSNNIWVKFQRWENGQVSAYWAPDSATMPVDGWQRFGADANTNFDEGLLGLAVTAHRTDRVADARFKGFAVNQSMIIDSFESYGDSNDAMREKWYVSGGSSTIRLRTNDNPDGQYGLVSSGATGSPDTALNVYNSSHDSNTGMAWGTAFRVEDETAYISLNVNGGNHALQPGRQRDGGTGVALWDVAANDYVPGTFTTSDTANNYGQHAISLAGLEGRWVMPVLVDREAGGWGWTGVDSITVGDGAVSMLNPEYPSYTVHLDYSFDEQADFMGWQQVDGNGNPVAISSFQIGDSPGNLLARHINQKGVFTEGEGFLSSTTQAGGWDSPTGIMRSPEFTLDGDILEFYIAGGDRDGLSFELWADELNDGNFVLQESSRHQADNSDFDYDFWAIRDLDGLTGYLQLVDNNPGSWGHIHLDAVRMVEFTTVPEPSTLILGGLAAIALALAGWRRRRKAA